MTFMMQAQGAGYMSRMVDGLEFGDVRVAAQRLADKAARAQREYGADLRVYTQPVPGLRGDVVAWYRFDGQAWTRRAGRVITGLEARQAPAR